MTLFLMILGIIIVGAMTSARTIPGLIVYAIGQYLFTASLIQYLLK